MAAKIGLQKTLDEVRKVPYTVSVGTFTAVVRERCNSGGSKTMNQVLTFGEMLMRLKTPGYSRILQADSFEAAFGGAEMNVAVSLAQFGDAVGCVTKLPQNPLGDAARNTLRRYGVDTSRVLRGGPRLGIYFFEKGTDIRPTNVVYDRAGSAFATAQRSEFDWPALLEGVRCFYFSGITAAVSPELTGALEDALACCKKRKIPVVCDLNYRGKMWTAQQAQPVMDRLMQYVTVCLANDEDFEASLGIRAFDGDMSRGIEQKEQFCEGMREITKRYPSCTTVASVLRNIHSVEDSEWMGILLQNGTFTETAVRKIHVMEGVGGGDAFGAGLMHGLLHEKKPQEVIDFALAASVLKLMIGGDLNLSTEAEVEAVMKKGAGAKLSR